MISKQITDKIVQFETPFYLYDIELLNRTLETVKSEADRYNYKVHYAIKANFEAKILQEVLKYGFGVDCVSGNEVKVAIEAGFPANSIVFAGVGKSDKEITYALEQGIFAFNCESSHELEIINELAAKIGVVANVALRINPDVDPKTHKHISTGHADSKFGIAYKEIEDVAARLDSLTSVKITGLHFHIGSQILDLTVFENLCDRVNVLVKWFIDAGYNLNHVNLGGGLGINYANPEGETIPNFVEYFSIFNTKLEIPSDMDVHFELGRSIVGQCGELISKVLYNKVTGGGKNFVIIDASMTELLRPALYSAHHAIENLSGGDGSKVYTIAGTVCESSDIFERDIELPTLNRGDLISLKSAGAYGSAMASRYNLHDLPISVYSDEI